MKATLEVCAADIQSVEAAAKGGAQRVELCCALSEGGLTPSLGMIEEAFKTPGIAVNVLIRPRSGDFLYSEREKEFMLRDIEVCRVLGVNGIVTGALMPDGEVDIDFCRRVTEASDGLHRTFHRAFDLCRDPRKAAADIAALGFDRILTSGQAPDAIAGATLIGELQKQYPSIVFIAAGGINPDNAAEIIRRTGVTEIHASAKTTVRSAMTFRHPGVSMGTPGIDEYSRTTTDSDSVAAIIAAISQIQ